MKRWSILLTALLLLIAAPACNSTLDDGDSPNVVLEIEELTCAPVTASEEGMGGCMLEVTDCTGTAANLPLSELALTQPFNDIILESVTIVYDWFDVVPDPATPMRVVGLADAIVPIGETGSFTFAPIAFQDLDAATLGQTANLTITFHGRTVEGTAIRQTVLRQLFVEACPAP